MTLLATARLTLRPLAGTDAAVMAQLLADGRVAAATSDIPHPFGLAQARAFLDWAEAETALGRLLALAMEDGGQMVGAIGLHLEDGPATVGYWVAPLLWGRGYASEALAAVLTHGFGPLGLPRIEADCLAGNAASARVLEKAGFRRAGQRTEFSQARGREVTLWQWRLMAADRVGF